MLAKIRSVVLCVYAAIAGLLLGGDYIWLQSSWTARQESVLKSLVADASLVSNLMQASLIDASKLLDFARTRIIEGSERRPLRPEAIHQILDSTLRTVSFSVGGDLRGLLFFIDPDARMVAQSGQFPAPAYDFSDRLYYRKLIDAPDAKFAVGNMLIAKTTGQLVFHISMPVRSDKGQLIGILVQQIRVHDLAAVIRESLEYPDAIIATRHLDDAVAFVFPVDASAPPMNGSACIKNLDKGSLVTGADERSDEKRLVGFAFSRVFDLCTSATLSESVIFAQFLRAHAAEFVGVALVFLLTTGLFMALAILLRRLDEEIEVSNHDTLTGLRNRRFLDAVYESYCRDSIRNRTSLSVLFLDLDHFKRFNDSYGHPTGDEILKSLGNVLGSCVKRPLDVCCRWGGEEFVVLLPDTSLEGAVAVARDIQDHLRLLELKSGPVRLPTVTVSVGVVSRALKDGRVLDDLVSLADKAMLEAKAQGRDRIVIYEDSPTSETVEANSVTNEGLPVTNSR